MKILPAIDLRDGACVQLVGGRYEDERVRLADPVAVAERWAAAGFGALHVVDLDAATGHGDNTALVARIIAAARVPVQAGGGVRDDAAVERLLALGAARVVVGTRAVADPAWLARIASTHPGRIVVALDTRDGHVVTHGWTQAAPLAPAEAVTRLGGLPLAAVLVTAVHREGRMEGPDLALIEALRPRTDLPLIASGGIATRGDLDALAARGVDAAVLGMALYTGALDPAALIEAFA